MAFGGGAFTAQNKTLPGAYINFVSAANASSALSDRGIATIALPLNWGADDKVFTVTASDFKRTAIRFSAIRLMPTSLSLCVKSLRTL